MPTLRTCPICKAQVPDDEPMVRTRVYQRRGRSYRGATWAPVCLECVRSQRWSSDDRRVSMLSTFVPDAEPVPCATCSRPVLLAPDARRQVTTCSDLCRSRYYGTRPRSVEQSVTPTCQGCGTGLIGRTDRRYCSSACRQRAYRRRSRLVAFGVPAEDAGHVDTFSSLDAEQFDAVLARARLEGDLSAAHLAELAEEVLRQS